jgi:hypothetical protein
MNISCPLPSRRRSRGGCGRSWHNNAHRRLRAHLFICGFFRNQQDPIDVRLMGVSSVAVRTRCEESPRANEANYRVPTQRVGFQVHLIMLDLQRDSGVLDAPVVNSVPVRSSGKFNTALSTVESMAL